MADVLEQFYLTLKKNPNIKGLPSDYKSFQEGLNDPEVSKNFFQAIKSNPNIKGLPNTYDEFADGLGLKKKDLSLPGSQNGFAPSQNTRVPNAPLLASQYAPMPAEMRYKAPKEKVGYGKQVMSSLESGANTFNAGLASTPKVAYDWLFAGPIKVLGGDPSLESFPVNSPIGYINAYIVSQQGNAKKIKEDANIDPEIQKGIVENLKNGNYKNAFKSAGLSVAESLPAMLGMALTGGATAEANAAKTMAGYLGREATKQTAMAAPFIANRWNEIADDPTMSQEAKIANSLLYGYSETFYEDKFGSLGLLKQAKKILSESGQQAAESFLKKGFIDAMQSGFKKYFPLSAPFINAFEEGATQWTQNATDILTGKDPNKDPLEGVGEAMAQGGAFGIGIGAVTGGAKYTKKKLLKKTIASNQPQVIDVVKTKLKEQLDDGEISQEDYDSTNEYIANTEAINTRIPASIPPEQRSKIIDITADRNIIMAEQAQLEQELENADDAFKPRIQGKIDALQGKVDAYNDSILGIESPIIYRQTEKGFEKEIDGRIEPITQEQFEYADANNLEGIEIEGKESAPVAESSKIKVYHAGTLDSDGNIYVTEDENIAKEYSGINKAGIKEFNVDKSKVATESVARGAIADLNLKDKNENPIDEDLLLYEIIDDRFETSLSPQSKSILLDYLKGKGFYGIEFKDQDITQKSKGGVNSIFLFDNPLNTPQDATTETQKPIEAGGAESSVEQYQGAQAEQNQTPSETDSSNSTISSQEAEPQKVIEEAVSLYDEIMNTEGGAKKRSLNDKRKALLDANPRVKHIFENMKNIQEALGERITKEGNCP